MIYETAVVLRPEVSEAQVEKLKKTIEEVATNFQGEVLMADDWGKRTFSQPTSDGLGRGHYFYFLYKADGKANAEIERRLNISEDVKKYLFVKVASDKEQEAIMKKYQSPFASDDRNFREDAKEKKMFARRKTCWFTANKMKADWKDPSSYLWTLNEFGKISPARVTGVSTKHQRYVTQAIKRARLIGLVGYSTNRLSY